MQAELNGSEGGAALLRVTTAWTPAGCDHSHCGNQGMREELDDAAWTLQLFEKSQRQGLQPVVITYTAVTIHSSYHARQLSVHAERVA